MSYSVARALTPTVEQSKELLATKNLPTYGLEEENMRDRLLDPNAKKEGVSKSKGDHIAKHMATSLSLISPWGSTDEVMRFGPCRRDTLSPFSELPCDMWVHVLEFLSFLDMLLFFQTCQTFCALKKRVRTIDVRNRYINRANLLTIAGLLSNGDALTTLNLVNTGINGVAPLAQGIKVSSALKKLVLCSNMIGDEGGTALGEGLKENKSLEELELSNCKIGAASAQGLAEGLFSSALTNLDLSFNTIGAPGAEALAGALKVSSALKKLVLYDNYITDAGASAIGHGLKDNKTLEELDLGWCSIGPAGTQGLAEGLFSSALTYLNLSGNDIGPTGAAAFAEAVKVSSALQTLDLCGNDLGPTGAAALAEALKVSSALTDLNLFGNGIGPNGATALAEALTVSSALKNLDLTNNLGIEGDSAQQLAAAALESKTLEMFSKVPIKELREDKLTELKLSKKGLGLAEAIVIAELVKVSSALKKLDLRYNRIKDEGASALGQGLKDNKTLQELDLFACDIGAAGAQGLAEGLFSSALKKLVLARNTIGDGGASAFGQGLKDNKMLEELDLRSCSIGPAGAQGLAEGLFSSALKNLDLTYNRGIEGESAQQLAAAALESKTLEVFSQVPIKELREDKLTELDLSREGLGPAEAIVVAELVKVSSALKES